MAIDYVNTSTPVYLRWGTYTKDGVITQAAGGISLPTSSGQAPYGLVVDEERNLWFAAIQYLSQIAYGSYDPVTGEPTLSGVVRTSLPTSYQNLCIAIDPILRLWWVPGEITAGLSYGTYDGGTGLPTPTGTQSLSGVTAVSGVDYMRRHLWLSNVSTVFEYDEFGVITPTAIPKPALIFGAAIDYDRSLMVGGEQNSYVHLYDLASSGALTEIDSISPTGFTHGLCAIDSKAGLIFSAGGDVISYCK
jgi:hypothetical protein